VNGHGSKLQTYRPRRVLSVVMTLAALLWGAAFFYLMRFEGLPLRLPVGALVFTVFFAVSATYYSRTAIFVDPTGVTYRGMLRRRRLYFSEIRRVDVLGGPITVYAVKTQNTRCHFTSLFGRHRTLMQLLVERSALSTTKVHS
jgi:hypothetical protein